MRIAGVMGLLVLAAQPGTSAAQTAAASVEPGEAVLRAVYERYGTTRFRSVTFLQKTTFADGRVEWWYEAESIPGKARVDIAPLADRNASIFRNDSAYIFRGGELRNSGSGLAITMWTLMDMYAIPPEQTAAAVRRRGVDLSRVHERMHKGRRVVVLGAAEPADTLAPQFWLDREHLYNVKIIMPGPGGLRVTDISDHRFMDGGWIEQKIEIFVNGRRTLLEEYNDTQVNVALPPDLFEPDAYHAPPWRERHETQRATP